MKRAKKPATSAMSQRELLGCTESTNAEYATYASVLRISKTGKLEIAISIGFMILPENLLFTELVTVVSPFQGIVFINIIKRI